MKQRRLGKTGLSVSEISLGTWQVGGGWGASFNEKTAAGIIEKSLSLGINFLDTADVYDEQQSEQMVGKYVGEHREQLYIATKIGRRIDPHVTEGYTPDVLEKYVDEALVNTGLEYLDLVQLHCPPTPVYQRDEIFQKLEEIKRSGKVRHFGVSVEKVEEAVAASAYDVVETVQIIFNMFRLKPLEVAFPTLKQRDIGIIVRVPLASGLLSGKMTPGRTFEPGDHRQFNQNGEVFDKGETFSGVPLSVGFPAVERLKVLFQTEELYKYALRWVLMFEEVSTVIPGASRPEQVSSNLAAAAMPTLSEEQLTMVETIYEEDIKAHVHELW